MNKDNYTQNEFYIDAVIKVKSTDKESFLRNKLQYLVNHKKILYNKIIFENGNVKFEKNEKETFNILSKDVKTFKDVLNYEKKPKKYVNSGYSYEFVIFNSQKEKRVYLYTSFFHAVIDGMGGYILLREFTNYLEGKITDISYDNSNGDIKDIDDDNKEIRIIPGTMEKRPRRSVSYKCCLREEYAKKFEIIMDNYNLSYVELFILLLTRVSYLFPDINLKTIDCILNLRGTKTKNKIGMYANILPLTFGFKQDFSIKNMSKRIKSAMFQTLKKRNLMRYKFGTTNSNCLISMIYSQSNGENYNVDWIPSEKIFYDYFLTLIKGEKLSFCFQIDEEIDFNIQDFSEKICELIDGFNNVNKKEFLRDIKLSDEVKEPSKLSYTSQFSLKNKLEATLNLDNGCYIFGEKKSIPEILEALF